MPAWELELFGGVYGHAEAEGDEKRAELALEEAVIRVRTISVDMFGPVGRAQRA